MKTEDPKTYDDRSKVAKGCASELKLTMPVLVDDMKDTVSKAYNADPDRLFIIGADAKKILKEEFKKRKLACGVKRKPMTYTQWKAARNKMEKIRNV